MIRPAKSSDSEQLATIYNHYILNSVITFEEETLSSNEMDSRVEDNNSDNLPWLVAEEDNEILGFAYASKWKGRCAYRFAIESTVYLSPNHLSQGWGSKLYEALFAELRNASYHVIMSGIALPNPGSIALHEKFGMEKVAHFKQVGYKFEQWVDVAYWQLILD